MDKVKRSMKRLLCVFAVMMMCGTSLQTVPAASKVTIAKQYYKNFLKGKQGYYKIVNIGGDKVPELVFIDQGSWTGRVYRFDSKKKKVKKLKSVAPGKFDLNYSVMYSTKTHMFCLSNGDTGGSVRRIYAVKSNKAVKKYTFTYHNGKFESLAYYINGKKVSEKTYLKKFDSLMKKYKIATTQI